MAGDRTDGLAQHSFPYISASFLQKRIFNYSLKRLLLR